MSGLGDALGRIAAQVEEALDAAVAALDAGVEGGVAVETADGLRRLTLRDEGAAAREFGTARVPAEPFLAAALAETRSDLETRLTEALRLEP
ncbi:hypothetical protein [Zavarzinia compransoris]|uniref:Uncharacterized protein n=1 Tax=Zavarzinia compransoris TaxID=1264899 RepID=A0A317DWN8_9PROT|nr:hypothetical protein [Zavarzinia compransoris]PWR19147.1 hypothetical protein DKG75_19535 [Zavarzinia compransoris]TDP49161.1 hypothetical protein DES42_101529 [Zavarzinia compransoris]